MARIPRNAIAVLAYLSLLGAAACSGLNRGEDKFNLLEDDVAPGVCTTIDFDIENVVCEDGGSEPGTQFPPVE